MFVVVAGLKNKLKHCSEKLNPADKIEAAVGKACLEIGFVLVFLNEEFHFELCSKEMTRKQFSNQINFELSNSLIFKTDININQSFRAQLPNVFTRNAATAFFDANAEAARYITEGLSRNKTLDEDDTRVWKFYLAKAFSRLVSKAKYLGGDLYSLKIWCNKALELFCRTSQGNDILSAQSYAHIGNIISSRKHILCQDETVGSPPSFIHDYTLDVWENPEDAFKRAQSILDNQ